MAARKKGRFKEKEGGGRKLNPTGITGLKITSFWVICFGRHCNVDIIIIV